MFKDAVNGLDKVFETDIPQGGIILITGTAGSLKSAFIYNLLSEYLKVNKSQRGVYVTLEETRKSHLRNMKSLGITLERRLKVSDIASFREHIGFEHIDYLDLIIKRIKKTSSSSKESISVKTDDDMNDAPNKNKPVKSIQTSCFALDSLNALYSLLNLDEKQIRNKLLEFFSFLRRQNLTSFIVLELSKEISYSDEFFLADGVIEFGITQSPEKSLKRYIQVRKMRATKHNLDPFVIEVRKNGLHVVGRLL
jgi:KaiC/GvpD/RAD55 family RecA-like ATPase